MRWNSAHRLAEVVVAGVLDLFRCHRQEVAVRRNAGSRPPAAEDLDQVLHHLLDRALAHAERGGELVDLHRLRRAAVLVQPVDQVLHLRFHHRRRLPREDLRDLLVEQVVVVEREIGLSVHF
jgi:hypothetical protein